MPTSFDPLCMSRLVGCVCVCDGHEHPSLRLHGYRMRISDCIVLLISDVLHSHYYCSLFSAVHFFVSIRHGIFRSSFHQDFDGSGLDWIRTSIGFGFVACRDSRSGGYEESDHSRT